MLSFMSMSVMRVPFQSYDSVRLFDWRNVIEGRLSVGTLIKFAVGWT